MSKTAPQVYEITLFDAEQHVMTECHMGYPIPEDWDKTTTIDRQDEREVHFLSIQQGAGAADYEARLMQPQEVKKLQRKLNREDLIDRFINHMSTMLGLDKCMELLPVMMAANEAEQADKLNSRFARG